MEGKHFKIEKIEKIIETKETVDLEECIKKLELNFESIGSGTNADVYIAKGTSFEKICFKKVKKNPSIKCNDINKEHEFQIEVRKLGVRTPLTLMSIETDEKEEYLVMEIINGCTVKEATENPSLLPKDFNYKIFIDDMTDQVLKMHNKKGRGVGFYHRDLHQGNVMINQDGLAVIIDFGTATEGSGSDLTYEEEVSMYNQQKGRYELVSDYFKDDLKMLEDIKNALKIYMKG